MLLTPNLYLAVLPARETTGVFELSSRRFSFKNVRRPQSSNAVGTVFLARLGACGVPWCTRVGKTPMSFQFHLLSLLFFPEERVCLLELGKGEQKNAPGFQSGVFII